MIRALVITSLFMGSAAWAGLESALRPVARPIPESQTERPLEVQALAASVEGLQQSLRPVLRPDTIAAQASAQNRTRKKGAVCGEPDIQGKTIDRIPGKIKGCGVQKPVRVRSVAGITLSQPAIMDCVTAKALKKWINTGAKPAVGGKGGGLSALRVAAHYACRTRNNKPGAKISEHGKGHAIDISGLTLKDGRTITVLKGWKGKDRRVMRQAHKAACGPFGTVLGPESDRYHQDHFHFDTARYRSGPYCR